MGINTLGSAIAAYRQAIGVAGGSTNKSDAKGTGTASSSTGSTATTAATSSSSAGGTSAKAAQVRQELDGLQTGIAQDLRSALKRAGLSLTGTVSFKVNTNGSLDITGSAADKAAVSKALNADSQQPSLASRIQSLDKRVEAYDAANTRNAALSSAARYAGRGQAANVMTLYQTLLSQNSSSSAVFSVSAQGSQLAFSGSVNATA